MTDEIERLAARGRAIEEERKEREAREKSSEGASAAREARKNQGASLSSFAGWLWIVLGIPLGLALGYVIGPLLPPSWYVADAESDPASMTIAFSWIAPSVVLFFLRPFFGRLAIAREEAWARALPFPLAGYFETLGRSPGDATVQLTLSFVGALPEPRLVHDALRTIGAEPVEPPPARTLAVRRSWEFESSASNNAFIANWVHRALPILTALHARHPIAEVRVEAR